MIKIHAYDYCRCGQQAAGHTVGVFHASGNGEVVTLEDIWTNKNRGLLNGKCKKFIPLDNLKYLEMIYEVNNND